MFRNYLTTAFRNFQRQAGYTILNILGLSVGIAATLFILLYLQHELSYDNYHEKGDRIYRISSDIKEPDNAFKWSVTQFPLGRALKADYAEVEEYVRFNGIGRTMFQLDDRQLFVEKVFIVDSTLFDVFTFDIVQGDPATALKEPNSILLNETEAKKIFGDENPIGKLLKTTREQPYKVTGIYKDMPSNSHLIANGLISSNSFPDNLGAGAWGGFSIYTYVLLHKGVNPDDFAAKLPEVIEKHVAVIFDQFDIKIKYVLLPLKTIHLESDFQGEPEPTGEMAYIYIFSAIGLFMLLIACINYMNLATARSARRALEVGIRKVLGSHRRHLVIQFLSESVILTLIALIIGVGLVMAFLPGLNTLFDLQLKASMLFEPAIMGSMFGIIILIGIIGGSYPALFLSGFQPIAVLKGRLSKGGSNVILRKGLVTTQFIITIFMLISTGIIYDQLNYVQNKDLGFDKEHVVRFRMENRAQMAKWPVLEQAITQHSNVKMVGTATSTPGNGFSKQLMNVENAEGVMEQKGVDNYRVDYDYFPTMGMEIVEGRNFSREFSTDSTQAVMVNEAMLKRMGWDKGVGKKFQLNANDTLPFFYVVGVVKDFHQQALYSPIEALLFIPRFNNPIAHVKIAGEKINQTIDHIESKWNEVFPNTPFEYAFVDEEFQAQYEEDQRRGRIFMAFSLLTIFIACLGLLGLASYTTEQRKKEISIRRVIGAGTNDILKLLTKDFAILVCLASIPAFFAAWYIMRDWLADFTYHTEMNYFLFGIGFLITLTITLFTTGYFALRAAHSDPVDALKYE